LTGRLASAPQVGRSVTFLEPIDRALVLGSSQPLAHVDTSLCAARGVDVVRRRSGGGAVLVESGSLLWVDVVVPASDPLWCSDVGRAGWWLGDVWAAALGGGFSVWKGPMRHTALSSMVCFAGIAAGEVVSTGSGAKVVGVSQRRSREGAAFQCACLLQWQPARLVELFALSPAEKTQAIVDLADVACGTGRELAGALEAAFVQNLP
jgi:lipoate-protein ligase A